MMKPVLLLFLTLALTQFCIANDAKADRMKVEFFEKLYDAKIEGVKSIEEYSDPDAFYAAIAKQVGIPQKAFKAVEEKFGWKQSDDYILSAMVKGGWDSDYWGVMVAKVPAALKTAKGKEERMQLLRQMEMKMVVIGYDGAVSFPEDRRREGEGSYAEPTAAQGSKAN